MCIMREEKGCKDDLSFSHGRLFSKVFSKTPKNSVLKIHAREFFPVSSSTGERLSWMNRLFMKKKFI